MLLVFFLIVGLKSSIEKHDTVLLDLQDALVLTLFRKLRDLLYKNKMFKWRVVVNSNY